PLADHPSQIDKSPYTAFWNNPIIFTDPDGRCVYCPDPSTAKEGDIVNPLGGWDFILTNGEWTAIGGMLGEVTVTAPRSAQGGWGFDVDKAVNWLNNNAHESWKDAKGECAKYIRLALEAGGLNTTGHPVAAWQYSSFLPKLGFTSVNTINYVKGDIAVMKGYPGATADPKTGIPYGHIQMFNGTQWVSDFKQRDFWPGVGYRTNKPAFEIFRWGTFQ
ncbi:hypothetical protein, partial [Schleiferia thermophila]